MLRAIIATIRKPEARPDQLKNIRDYEKLPKWSRDELLNSLSAAEHLLLDKNQSWRYMAGNQPIFIICDSLLRAFVKLNNESLTELILKEATSLPERNCWTSFLELDETNRDRAYVHHLDTNENYMGCFLDWLLQSYPSPNFSGIIQLHELQNPANLLEKLRLRAFEVLELEGVDIDAAHLEKAIELLRIEKELSIAGELYGNFKGFKDFKMAKLTLGNACWLTSQHLTTLTQVRHLVAHKVSMTAHEFAKFVVVWSNSLEYQIESMCIWLSYNNERSPRLSEIGAKPVRPGAMSVTIGDKTRVVNTGVSVKKSMTEKAIIVFFNDIFFFEVQTEGTTGSFTMNTTMPV